MKFVDPDAKWMELALCGSRDQFLHFADHDFGKQALNRMEKRAIQMCFQCPVRNECLRYAVDKRERHGIWGGSLDTDRQPIYALLDRHHEPQDARRATEALDAAITLRATQEGLIGREEEIA